MQLETSHKKSNTVFILKKAKINRKTGKLLNAKELINCTYMDYFTIHR